ncbi:PTS N-acetylglucosamine transporter subunit IIBC [Cryobacterium sp. LW097]|uniref:PTS transporter subunit EIIC n=1 Tax=unclassified Cryobacterium TaxID=2649013 RepID=UPI000B4D0EE4|nr:MULTISPECIES: PTS transporter subunit EIIC [unclassified Cryobacterium]ASD23258.1 PTS N-acetylglucosamine transporter subunit IIBC [Cryobacterium sp. LW097]TFC52730.1 PTS N-acetylglucosamine transporter subunit IIBC [Cryobacterium sp. TMB3-1-2]TFC60230.1 PTS N-acetylglucosamine transporter subunit IIBC [Cryobacterium sp. TMB1-7]TFC68323.1 PTS N-acetylglucosamine transporter subunit IIBC [Cryobacterium sp. TMB3-15]TFC74976.1 PTS N-acetylglucosamine transporter subunit IIBC [Cryobacterium sp.
MSSTTVDAGTGRKVPGLAQLQRVGRSLMLPIAALPAAGLLLRLGQPDLLGAIPGFETGAAVIGAAGGALFDNLALLFALGVAIGYAKKADGSTALAAVVGYLVFTNVGKAMSPFVMGLPAKGAEQVLVDYNVLAGVLMGVVSAVLWQKYHRIKLPSYLAFFGGRRFVPIVTAVVALVLGVLLSFLYPAFSGGLTNFGSFVSSNDVWGGFLYGTSNRLLIPVGLHHILNSVMWFVLGDYNGATGDLHRFFAGDPTAGSFMTGFFPIMMFALPAGALAIWHEAKKSQKKIVGGIMLSGALTAMLTGVTEPLEFSFMFVAFPLYAIHAVLTGTSLALVNFLGIRDGFTFSAGAFDYILNFGLAEKPLLLIPIGLAYAALYYFLFRFVIRRWNLKTPGRGDDIVEEGAPDSTSKTAV